MPTWPMPGFWGTLLLATGSHLAAAIPTLGAAMAARFGLVVGSSVLALLHVTTGDTAKA